MVDYIRSLVSGSKQRYVDRKYNLDLTYITPKLIAMAYPASGFDVLYRNHIDTVSKFLEERHSDKYIVINLSGKNYDKSKFNNRYNDNKSNRLQLGRSPGPTLPYPLPNLPPNDDIS